MKSANSRTAGDLWNRFLKDERSSTHARWSLVATAAWIIAYSLLLS